MDLVYVLKLENDMWYVGLSSDLPCRLAQHFLGRGSVWTRLHKPLSVVQVIPGGRAVETAITIQTMVQRGWRNVRGGQWTSEVLEFMPLPIAKALSIGPPRPPRVMDSLCYDFGGQALCVKRVKDGYQARVSGPMAVGAGSRGVLFRGESEGEARAKAEEWINRAPPDEGAKAEEWTNRAPLSRETHEATRISGAYVDEEEEV